MKAQAVYAAKADTVELQDFEIDESALDANQVLLKTAYSVISPGTELDCVSGREASWFHFPQQLGYCAVAKVIAVGGQVAAYQVGDTVLSSTAHASHATIDAASLRAKVPPDIDRKLASLVHIVLISITALRVSSVELGDRVAVLGQGLVGNLAAQLFGLQGGRVIAIDRLPGRLEVAKKCRIEMVVDASQGDPVQTVKDLTGGDGAEVVVEATGSAAAALQAAQMAARNGEVILLGTPRGSYEADVVPLLRAVHRASPNLTIKGAHGYSIPQTPDPYVKHSVARNATLVLDMVRRGELVLVPLISRIAKPAEAAEVYRELRDNPESLLGVVFDWGD